MIFMKHAGLGNAHFPAAEQAQREAEGWVRWPRTRDQKLGLVASVEPQLSAESGTTPEPVKRGPGRPKKAA